MNRTEIEAKWDTLTERERDAWVAEAVFGYYWTDLFPHMKSVEKIRMLIAPIGDVMRNVGGLVDSYGIPDNLPNYTTDISAAWAVVEAMRENYVYEIADFGRNKYKETAHYAAFHRVDKYRDYERQVRSSSVSKAICLAALIAKLTNAAEVS